MGEDIFHLGIKAVIRNSNDEILLLKVNLNNLSGTEEAYWDIPGGRVQKGSNPEDTLIREIKEETGLENILNIRPLTMVLSNLRIPVENGDVGLILSIFLCDIENIEKIELSEEHTKLIWANPKEAAELLKTKYPPEFVSKIATL